MKSKEIIPSDSLLSQNWPKHFFKQKIQGNHLIEIHFEVKICKKSLL